MLTWLQTYFTVCQSEKIISDNCAFASKKILLCNTFVLCRKLSPDNIFNAGTVPVGISRYVIRLFLLSVWCGILTALKSLKSCLHRIRILIFVCQSNNHFGFLVIFRFVVALFCNQDKELIRLDESLTVSATLPMFVMKKN